MLYPSSMEVHLKMRLLYFLDNKLETDIIGILYKVFATFLSYLSLFVISSRNKGGLPLNKMKVWISSKLFVTGFSCCLFKSYSI